MARGAVLHSALDHLTIFFLITSFSEFVAVLIPSFEAKIKFCVNDNDRYCYRGKSGVRTYEIADQDYLLARTSSRAIFPK